LDYQRDFGRGRANVDQLFAMRIVMEEACAFDIDFHLRSLILSTLLIGG
jgi:hypothetical protein